MSVRLETSSSLLGYIFFLRATKIIPELANLPYEERLRQLNLTTLEDRRDRGDLIEVYTMLHGFENI